MEIYLNNHVNIRAKGGNLKQISFQVVLTPYITMYVFIDSIVIDTQIISDITRIPWWSLIP